MHFRRSSGANEVHRVLRRRKTRLRMTNIGSNLLRGKTPTEFVATSFPTIFSRVFRLPNWMNEAASPAYMELERMALEQDQRISEVVKRERSRLLNFIRRRVPDPGDAEDVLQEVFYRLVEANRLLMPIEHITGWLFQVARNRITDLFRKKQPENFSDVAVESDNGEDMQFEDLLPSPDAGPEAEYARKLLLDELKQALAELPKDQREVFVSHEFEGRSFKELAAETGVNVNTLLARKRYAVLHLRERLQRAYNQFLK